MATVNFLLSTMLLMGVSTEIPPTPFTVSLPENGIGYPDLKEAEVRVSAERPGSISLSADQPSSNRMPAHRAQEFGYHKIHASHRTFASAQCICKAKGAHLATPDYAQDMYSALYLVARTPLTGTFLIGVRRNTTLEPRTTRLGQALNMFQIKGLSFGQGSTEAVVCWRPTSEQYRQIENFLPNSISVVGCEISYPFLCEKN